MRSLILALIACMATLPSLRAADFTIPAGDDAAAGRAFARWSTGIGYKPENVDDEGAFVLREKYVWMVELKTSQNYLNRVVLTAVFSGTKSNLSNPAAMAFVNKLNASYNIGAFSVDSDGDIIFQYTMTFEDALSAAAYRKFIKCAEFVTQLIIDSHKSEFDRFTK